jgi:hypothetical protein
MINDLDFDALMKQLDTLFPTDPQQLSLPFPEKPKDICPKCGAKGVFVKTALVCPKDKTLIGGI